MSTSTKTRKPASRRDAKKAVRREAILAAAANLFGRNSYDAVQMDDVAKAADIGKPALYRYFPSKEDLFLEVSDDALLALERALHDLGRAGRQPDETLHRMIALLAQVLPRHLASLRLLSGEHPILAARWRLLFRKRRQAINAALAAVLRKGAASGVFQSTDASMTPAMIIGMIRGAVMENPDISVKHLTALAVHLTLNGVRKTK